MFCPQCGSNQSDDIKFCKTCGGNLSAVRQAVAMRDVPEKFDWSKTWVARNVSFRRRAGKAKGAARASARNYSRGQTRERAQGGYHHIICRHRGVDLSVCDYAGSRPNPSQSRIGGRNPEPSLGSPA